MFFPSEILFKQIVDAGIPNSGMTIGAIDDRSTWRVDFSPEATAEQRTQAATIIQAFDVDQARQQIANRAILQETDARMCRIAEDLIDHLVSKGVIDLQDFPDAARDLLTARKAARFCI